MPLWVQTIAGVQDMKAYQRNSILFLAVLIVIVGASFVYLIISGNPSSQAQSLTNGGSKNALHASESSSSPEKTAAPRPCAAKGRPVELGIAFPDYGHGAYGQGDTNWNNELPQMKEKTASCWTAITVLLHQDSLFSTSVVQGDSTTSPVSFRTGIRTAHSLGLHVFVAIQLQASGSQPWAGALNFSSLTQEQQWFDSYYAAIKPYATIAQQEGVEQFALGTEFALLEQNAPVSMWNQLIDNVSQDYTGTLTYDMNWGSLDVQPPSWMGNPHLKMIGVSAYSPLVTTPQRVDPSKIGALWKTVVQPQLDDFAREIGKPIFLSEVGYPNSEYALYQPWNSSINAPADPQEQAAAMDAALSGALSDQHILGVFIWGWDNTGDFNLTNAPLTASVVHEHFTSLQS
jgi:hypothetical protein